VLQTVLDQVKGKGLKVLVVWEPVIASDTGPPDDSVLTLLSDPRIVHFWDEDRALSKALVRTWSQAGIQIKSEGRSDPDLVIWDFVAVYPSGVHWDGSLAPALHYGSPVVDQIEQVRAKLRVAVPPV